MSIKHGDDIGAPLTQAMMLLEMSLDDAPISIDLVWAAHSLVQLAWKKHVGEDAPPLPYKTLYLLANIEAVSAIESAKSARG